MKKYFAILPLSVLLLSGCQFDEKKIEFDYTSIYIANQTYNRNLVVGEGLRFKMGVIFAGQLQNGVNRDTEYMIDPSLVNTLQQAMPSDYYTAEHPNTIRIPSGSMKGYLNFEIDSLKFLNDPKSLTGDFVLPFRITSSPSVDKITENKDHICVSISYMAKQFGNYTYSGETTIEGRSDALTYSNKASDGESIRSLITVGPTRMRVVSDSKHDDPMSSFDVSFEIDVPVHGGGEVKILPSSLSSAVVSAAGESSYDEASRTFTLRYSYTNADNKLCTATDVMKFRNRIRDVQENGIYINEY